MTGKSISTLAVALTFAAGFLLLPSAALGDVMTYVGVYNSAAQMGGVYDSPYWLTINGMRTLAICDDYTNEIASGWNANEYTLSQITPATSGTQKFYNGSSNPNQDLVNTDITLDYEVAALLASELMSPAILNDQTNGYYWAGVYSYAIWSIFDTQAIYGWGGTSGNPNTTSQERADIAATRNAAFTTVQNQGGAGVSFTIYTPEPNTISQEFLVITPEASAVTNLAIDLLAVLGAVVLLRKRVLRNAGALR